MNSRAREELAADALVQIELRKLSPRKALSSININNNAQERPAVFALVQETVRRRDTIKRIINFLLNQESVSGCAKAQKIQSLQQLPLFVQQLLLVGIYRSLFESPKQLVALSSATIQQILKTRNFNQFVNLINKLFFAFEDFNVSNWFNSFQDTAEKLAVEFFFPTWLVRQFLDAYTYEETKDIFTFFNQLPPVYIRTNNLVPQTLFYKEIMEKKIELEQDNTFKTIYRVKASSSNRLPILESYKQGEFYIQAKTSAYIPLYVDPKSGERILDACASPGGKTIFMADLIKNNGEIVAIDNKETRVQELNKNLQKYGVTCAKTLLADVRNLPEMDLFDRILVDAPCSGTGTLGVRPYSKWRLSKSRLRQYSRLQLQILNTVSKFCKPSGLIFYVTCSLLPQENELVIEKFLSNHADNYQCIPLKYTFGKPIAFYGQRLLPHVMESEGFSIFCLKAINKEVDH